MQDPNSNNNTNSTPTSNPVDDSVQAPSVPNIPVTQVSGGSPEAQVSIDTNKEAPPIAPEYGYEAIKTIEDKPESLQRIEKKEPTPQSNINPQQPNKKIDEPVKPVQPIAIGPKSPTFFGYKIPSQLANNPLVISQQKGKGDPTQARTWIFMLLDRLLKKQTYGK